MVSMKKYEFIFLVANENNRKLTKKQASAGFLIGIFGKMFAQCVFFGADALRLPFSRSEREKLLPIQLIFLPIQKQRESICLTP